ncbi:MAG: hypothetical protein KF812_05950 [Fimbriimonadaceae bacterium]|nr:hypothetical protein [Fimbriimonadaceae bacterium]
MLRIVGVDMESGPEREGILLQNQGVMNVDLHGIAVIAEAPGLDGVPKVWHVFAGSKRVLPRGYVLLRTGVGVPCEARTKDGHPITLDYAQQTETLKDLGVTNLRLLVPSNSFPVEPVPHIMLR